MADRLWSYPNNTCPGCGQNRVCSIVEARQVYQVSDWGGNTDLMQQADDDEKVCPYCRAIRIDGSWTRMMPVAVRAASLAQTNNKTVDEYRETLTDGPKDI